MSCPASTNLATEVQTNHKMTICASKMDIVITEELDGPSPREIGNGTISIQEAVVFKTDEITKMNRRIHRTSSDVPPNGLGAFTYETFVDRLSDYRRFHSCSAIDANDNKRSDKTALVANQQYHIAPVASITPNYCIETNLESSQNSSVVSRPDIIDSHTAYRKILDEKITDLKVQLAKTQAYADKLEHERNQNKVANDQVRTQLELATEETSNSTEKMAQLETVVSHLQERTREGALERVALQAAQLEHDNKLFELQLSTKKYRNEYRKLKKELVHVHQEMEGKAMEVQGLRSENDWLKKQLWPEKNNVAESDGSDDANTVTVVTGIRQFLSPRKPRRRRRRSRQTGSTAIDKETDQDNAQEREHAELRAHAEDAEDRTAGYSSLTDFHLRSAPESGPHGEDRRNSSKKLQRQNSLIRKLAVRHGVTDLDDESQSRSYRSQDNANSLAFRFARKSPKSSSNRKSRDRDHHQEHITSSLSKVHIHEKEQPRKEEITSGNQWNFWGMFNGNGSKPNDKEMEEDSTKELSDSSIFYDEYLLQTKFRSSHTSQLAAVKKVEHQAKSGTVLVPKRFSAI